MKRVMVIDDEPHILFMVEKILKKKGYDVEVAERGEDGLKKIEKKIPDVLLLDLMMPDISGFEIARLLRKKKETKKIPIVAFTILDKEESVDLEKAPKFEAYLAKPFDIDDLLALVKKLAK